MQQPKECARCDSPQGHVVILDNREPVCGGCITQIARVADISHCIALDMTPSIECGVAA